MGRNRVAGAKGLGSGLEAEGMEVPPRTKPHDRFSCQGTSVAGPYATHVPIGKCNSEAVPDPAKRELAHSGRAILR